MKRRKFGVYISEELAQELENIAKSIGIRSRSALVRMGLKLLITEHSWRTLGRAAGIIGVIYRHGIRDVDREITEIQHTCLDIILSTLHIHLDEEKCMLAIAVKGEVSKLKNLLERIESIPGVELARPLLLSTL